MPARDPATPSCIAITGASSGIGRALALHYAAPGRTLFLVARDAERLRETDWACRDRGAVVLSAMIDVRERETLSAWLLAADRARTIDLVIANAGVMDGVQDGEALERVEASHAIFDTNLIGVLNAVQPLLPLMIGRRSGRIAMMSSIAGFIPLPDAPSYGASKAALISYGLALRANLAGAGVGINVIAPGYVATAMTARASGWKPFALSADEAARRIARGLAMDRPVIAFPWFFSIVTRIGGALPYRLRLATQAAFRFRIRGQPAAPSWDRELQKRPE